MHVVSDITRIDAVITWVDGQCPVHLSKRNFYQPQAPRNANAINPHRWACNDELGYCLRSIANHAPWIGRIWIITDAQTPDLTHVPRELAARITIVDHLTLFAGYEDALPTFNSLSIETFLWRIQGLAEQFIYFNDDVFLTSRVSLADFFTDTGPVMRGQWVDYSHLLSSQERRSEAALLNLYTQIEAAELAGYRADHMFSSAHVVHPMLRSVMAELFEKHRDRFMVNSAYRFRSTKQFLPQGLHNHHCIKNGLGRIHCDPDHLHLAANISPEQKGEEIVKSFQSAKSADMKFLCVNDLPELEGRFPEARDWIEEVIGA